MPEKQKYQRGAEWRQWDAAVLWCNRPTIHSLSDGGKPWEYVLIPHDLIARNMTLERLSGQFAAS